MQGRLPKRKGIRLKGYDYSQNGAYFITICSHNRETIFAEISVGQGLCSCRTTPIGGIIEEEIIALPARYPYVAVDQYAIMPNHVHMTIMIDRMQQGWRQEQSPCPTGTIGDVVCALKSITTKRANQCDGMKGRKIWQARYHDRIIRDEAEYLKIWQYIDENPARWVEDVYFENGEKRV